MSYSSKTDCKDKKNFSYSLSYSQFFCIFVAKEFKKQYGKLPKDSLIEEPFDKKYQQLVDSPQMILDELIDEESEKITKPVANNEPVSDLNRLTKKQKTIN